ncbi:glycosyltransferase family 4 protein [Gluconacetobacter sacchari]|uniref:glycosyltransferase family 4 protein n=1 Tax=Gluconacetobacter sacchari TaxID=92759 RepID=UPI0039B5FAB9
MFLAFLGRMMHGHRSMTAFYPFPCPVGIDGFNLALAKGTGIATYARVLSRNLKALGCTVDVLYGLNVAETTNTSLREVLFFDQLGHESHWRRGKFLRPRWLRETLRDVHGLTAVPVAVTENVEKRIYHDRLPAFDRLLNIQGLFQRATDHFRRTGRMLRVHIPNPPPVMHWTYPLPIMVVGTRNVYTIHDVVPLRFPGTTLDNKSFHFKLLKRLCAEATALCTVSEASRRDILSFFPEVEGRIFNTYQSLDSFPDLSIARPLADEHEMKKKYGLAPGRYFLFCGSLEPKKNIDRLVQAFLAAGVSCQLVVIGAMAWKSEEASQMIDYGVSIGRIVRLDYVSRATLDMLMAHARAVLFPSLTEGFGLPVLEAMALGTPVLTSREAALPEVTGEAAIHIDAYDLASIEEGITRLDQDDALCAALAAAGPRQAEFFNPARYQKRLADFYRAVLELPGPA